MITKHRRMRTIAALLCTTMIFGLPACGSNAGQTTGSEASGETPREASTQAEQSTVAEETETDVDTILANMSLRDKIGQMMFVSYRVWKEVPKTEAASGNATVENAAEEIPAVNVTELNDEIRASIKANHFGGTVLFAENYADAEQTVKLIADIQKTNLESGGLPLLVATDQEGGNVARIGYGTPGVGNMALAATGDPQNAKTMASIYGEELRLLGVNTDYAPVMDVNNNPNNPVIGVRSFSDDPATVARFGLSYMEGLHDTGTIATLKHFPGHGNTDTDSHTRVPYNQRRYEELQKVELIPFQQAIDAGADMVMTAHIQYPQIETGTYTSLATGEQVYLPATMSRTILWDILREDMGFEGVIVSDALDMAAISENFATEDILTLTINSGVNMLILPIITNTELFQKTQDMVDLAVQLAEEGRIDTGCIDDSVRRILTLKQKYGLLDQTDFEVTEAKLQAAQEGVGSAAHRETAWNIAQQAVTVVKNENEAFPLKLEAGQSVLILFADSCASRVGNGELVEQLLRDNGRIPEGAQITTLVNGADNEKECMEAVAESDHVILVYRTYGAANLDPNTGDGFSSAVFDRIIEERHKADKQVILVSCQLPYDAARFPGADAIVLAYNSSAMREIPPETGKGSGYIPNLPATLCACFGDGKATGSLPLALPRLDEDHKVTDQILYERN